MAYDTRRTLTPAQWLSSTQRILQRFAPVTGKVVLLAPPPMERNVQDCYNRFNRPSACLGRVSRTWFDHAAVEAQLAARLGGAHVDTRPLFCDGRGLCPGFVGRTLVRPDVVHVSPAYGTKLVPVLTELLDRAGVL